MKKKPDFRGKSLFNKKNNKLSKSIRERNLGRLSLNKVQFLKKYESTVLHSGACALSRYRAHLRPKVSVFSHKK